MENILYTRLEFRLPFPHFLAVQSGNSKRFDGIKIIKRLYLKGHHITAHFPYFLSILPLLGNQELGHQQHDRRTGKCQQRHNLVIMPDHHKGCDEIINCYDDRWKPAYGVAADRCHISVKTVQYVTIAVLIDLHPVRIDDFIENICLDIIINVDTQFCGHTVDHIGKYQTEYGTSKGNRNHRSQPAGLISCDNIDHILAGHTADQSHGSTEDSENRIK